MWAWMFGGLLSISLADEDKKDKDKKEDTEEKEEKSDEDKFAEKIKDLKKIDGFFTVYLDEKKGSVLMEIDQSRIDSEFL